MISVNYTFSCINRTKQTNKQKKQISNQIFKQMLPLRLTSGLKPAPLTSGPPPAFTSQTKQLDMKSRNGPPESYHGFPTLEADAALDVVVASRTFFRVVVIQHRAGEPLQGQITCTLDTVTERWHVIQGLQAVHQTCRISLMLNKMIQTHYANMKTVGKAPLLSFVVRSTTRDNRAQILQSYAKTRCAWRSMLDLKCYLEFMAPTGVVSGIKS